MACCLDELTSRLMKSKDDGRKDRWKENYVRWKEQTGEQIEERI